MVWHSVPLSDKAFSANEQTYSQWETGDIKWSASTATSKTGWLEANGQAVSRTQYKRLFDEVGTTYGVGDGSTTFNVPNIAGKVCVGIDSGDADFDTMGETQGAKTVTLTAAQSGLPAHTHAEQVYNGLLAAAGSDLGGLGHVQEANQTVNQDTAANATANAAEAHSNLQPSITLRAWVKT